MESAGSELIGEDPDCVQNQKNPPTRNTGFIEDTFSIETLHFESFSMLQCQIQTPERRAQSVASVTGYRLDLLWTRLQQKGTKMDQPIVQFSHMTWLLYPPPLQPFLLMVMVQCVYVVCACIYCSGFRSSGPAKVKVSCSVQEERQLRSGVSCQR